MDILPKRKKKPAPKAAAPKAAAPTPPPAKPKRRRVATPDPTAEVRSYLTSIGADTAVLDVAPPTVDQLLTADDRPFEWVGEAVDKLGAHGKFARAVTDAQVRRLSESGYTAIPEGATMRGVAGGTAMWCPAAVADAKLAVRKARSDARRGRDRSGSRGNLDSTVSMGGGKANVWARSASARVNVED